MGAVVAQPSKRAGSPALPSSVRAKGAKSALRQASAWEEEAQQELRPRPASGTTQAEASPTRALLRLQEQRQHQRGSRLGAPVQQQEQPSWEAAGARADGELLSPPSSSGRGSLRSQQPGAAAGPAAVAALPDGRLAHTFSSALDEQIALLESDLAQLDSAPSPITQLCKAAAEARPPPLALPRGQQQQRGQQGQAGIAAWRRNGAFDAEGQQQPAAAGGGGAGQHQLLSPGATPARGAGAAAGRGESPGALQWQLPWAASGGCWLLRMGPGRRLTVQPSAHPCPACRSARHLA